jgi:5-hydroxyisourate hydrolase
MAPPHAGPGHRGWEEMGAGGHERDCLHSLTATGRGPDMRIVAQVLDGTYGKPAVGVRAFLTSVKGDGWTAIAEAETSSDGCIEEWDSWELERGLYRIVLDSDSYFAGLGATSTYTEIAVVFRMRDEAAAFQVQVTLTPCSYSTFFGTLQSRPGRSG